MKIYKTQRQVEKDIKDGILAIEGDVKFECSISIDASIVVIGGDITAGNICAHDITAKNIIACNITAGGDIDAGDINVRNVTAFDVTAGNIIAGNIDARDILYYAVCFAYQDIKCVSINGKRENARHFCLDGEITIKKEEPKETIKIGDNIYDKQEVEKALENVKSLNGGNNEQG